MRKAIIYGCGQQGRGNYNYLKTKYDILAYSSSHQDSWGKLVYELPVVPPDKIMDLIGEDGIVIISFAQKYGEVMRWCERENLAYVLCLDERLYNEENAVKLTRDGNCSDFTPNLSVTNPVQIMPEYRYADVLELLQKKVPVAYQVWRKLVERMEQETLNEPLSSMSFEGHSSAYSFRQFLMSHVHGCVLDIGCGISEKPEYLKGYPDCLLTGIDPLLPVLKEHPFSFVQGVCEYLPFADNSFDEIVMATSFDHILLIKESMNEITRVLKKNGKLIIWEAFLGAEFYYDPYAEKVKPYDLNHLFHLSRGAFEGIMMANGFRLIDHVHFYDSHFKSYGYFYAFVLP